MLPLPCLYLDWTKRSYLSTPMSTQVHGHHIVFQSVSSILDIETRFRNWNPQKKCKLFMSSSSSYMNFCSNIPCNELDSSFKLDSSLHPHFKTSSPLRGSRPLQHSLLCLFHTYSCLCAYLSMIRALHTSSSFYDLISILPSLSSLQRPASQPLTHLWLAGPSTAAYTWLVSKQNRGLSSPCLLLKGELRVC